MSADDDDRGTDPAFEAPVDLKERCRRAIAFLQRARDLPDLSPAQIDRIERRLHEAPARPARRLLLSPALAALIVLSLAGGALAMAGRDRTWLSGISRWLGARHAPAPRAAIRAPRAEAPAAAAPPAVTAERASTAAARMVAGSARTVAAPVGSRKAHPLPDPPPRRTAGEGIGASASHPLPSAREGIGASASHPLPSAREGGVRAGLARGEVTAPPGVEPPPAPSPLSPAARAAETTAVTPAVPAPAPIAAANPIVAESRSFASALERWHREHDADAALAELDVHERRFPSGQLGLEARLLRVEILLASGRAGDALALLDHMGIAGVPRARELRTVRGELRIKLGRCADGKADLKTVLGAGTADALAQRARQAMATCP